MIEINGTTAPGFERVRDAFEGNFAKGLEIGASFSAYHRGERVVDLWGGIADVATNRPWDERALALVFSTTKCATAICANKLAQEGKLDVDAPVARYWPEFAAGGKADIPVKFLLSHQAGLAWVDAEMTLAEALSWDPVVDALARQVPHYEPGSQHGYHATTYGWLVGEVIRRVTDKSVGTYFREEIAAPLADPLLMEDPEVRALVNEFMGPETMLGKALFAPGGALSEPDIWNSRALHAAEIPAAGGVGDARSLARLYSACIGTVDGVRLLDEEQLRRATTQLTTGPNTVLLDMDIQFGLGFMLRSTLIELGGPRSFGHFGAGGSVGWADPDAELAFGYVMNRMDMGLAGDLRSYELMNACFDAVR
jgi:CubicO group peptidase (beta-lactamase class C family)